MHQAELERSHSVFYGFHRGVLVPHALISHWLHCARKLTITRPKSQKLPYSFIILYHIFTVLMRNKRTQNLWDKNFQSISLVTETWQQCFLQHLSA